MSKIYFDTTPIIYFLDDEKPFSDKIATFYGCDIFLTNDAQLKQVIETNVLLVDDM